MRRILGGCRAVPSAAALGMLVLAPAWAGAARVQAVTAAQAQSLEAQVRVMLTGMLGPKFPIGQRPVQITAEGNHFAVSVPITGPVGTSGVVIKAPPLTAKLRPLDKGRWALNDVLFPSPLHVTIPAGKAEPSGEWTIAMQSQDQHAVIDPTLAGPSTWDSTIKGYSTELRTGADHFRSLVGQMTAHVTWDPTGNGRASLAEDVTAEHLSGTTQSMIGLVSFTAAHATATVRIDTENLGELPKMIHAALEENAAGGPAKVPASAKPAGTSGISKLDEVLTLDGVSAHFPGGGATLQHLKIGFLYASSHGKLRLRLLLGFDGLESPSLPPAMRAYLPRHFLITPELRGIPATQLAALLHQASKHGMTTPAPMGQLQTLLSQGPVTLAVDQLSLAAGPATVEGAGDVSVAQPMQIDGKALVKATGLDALIQQAQTDPMLKQAEPVLLMVKALGAADGAKTVWDVSYHDGRAIVNGHDLMQMGRHDH